ncbi:MAG: hypothetical protein HYR83_09670 [Planctomycetes bacterium]|nr:hypothetical protein [Planctomycetota bacterium]
MMRPEQSTPIRALRNVSVLILAVVLLYFSIRHWKSLALLPQSKDGHITLTASAVSSIEVDWNEWMNDGSHSKRIIRSDDRFAIDSLVSALKSAESVSDCKCPELGGIRFRGRNLDIELGIMPGHAPGRIDLHELNHRRWSVPIDDLEMAFLILYVAPAVNSLQVTALVSSAATIRRSKRLASIHRRLAR